MSSNAPNIKRYYKAVQAQAAESGQPTAKIYLTPGFSQQFQDYWNYTLFSLKLLNDWVTCLLTADKQSPSCSSNSLWRNYSPHIRTYTYTFPLWVSRMRFLTSFTGDRYYKQMLITVIALCLRLVFYQSAPVCFTPALGMVCGRTKRVRYYTEQFTVCVFSV